MTLHYNIIVRIHTIRDYNSKHSSEKDHNYIIIYRIIHIVKSKWHLTPNKFQQNLSTRFCHSLAILTNRKKVYYNRPREVENFMSQNLVSNRNRRCRKCRLAHSITFRSTFYDHIRVQRQISSSLIY